MKIIQTLPQSDLGLVPAAAKQAEESGFDMLMTMENKHDPFLALAVAATATTSIELGPGVAIAFARSPMVVANVSWDLQTASKGRYVLGLGPQIRPHNEKRFSVPWSPPVPRLREYVHALRAIWTSWETGERLRDLTLELYGRGSAYAETKGVILADTKFEFGLADGELVLIDEALTPDSSRYWETSDYEPGRSQASFDKQPVRDWLEQSGWDKSPPPPDLPDEVVRTTSERYREIYRRLAGKEIR